MHLTAYSLTVKKTSIIRGEFKLRYFLELSNTSYMSCLEIMQHTGELCECLGAHGAVEVGWEGEFKASFTNRFRSILG